MRQPGIVLWSVLFRVPGLGWTGAVGSRNPQVTPRNLETNEKGVAAITAALPANQRREILGVGRASIKPGVRPELGLDMPVIVLRVL